MGNVISYTTELKTPKGGHFPLNLIWGILNLFFFGVGTIIAGILDGVNLAHIIIGILQLVIPFVGWLWSIIWGILMIIRSL